MLNFTRPRLNHGTGSCRSGRAVWPIASMLLATQIVAASAQDPASKQTKERGDNPGRIFVFAKSVRRDGVIGTFAIEPNDGARTQITREGFYTGRLSPDGGKLAYNKLNDNNMQSVWIMNATEGASPRRILDGDASACWSPDGNQLVLSIRKKSGDDVKYETWKVAVNGDDRAKLPLPDSERVIDWSADGKWFLTASSRLLPDGSVPVIATARPIYAMRDDGSDEQLVVEGSGGDPSSRFARQTQVKKGTVLGVGHRFSPDGQTVAYCRKVMEGNSGVWIVDRQGRKGRELIGGTDQNMPVSLNWSPDGRQMAVSFRQGTGREATCYIEVLDLRSNRRRRLEFPEISFIYLLDWR